MVQGAGCWIATVPLLVGRKRGMKIMINYKGTTITVRGGYASSGERDAAMPKLVNRQENFDNEKVANRVAEAVAIGQ
jgi:hypothetical protein